MNNPFQTNGFSSIPVVTKNLLIINIIGFIAYMVLSNSFGISLNYELGLYYIGSDQFKPVQLVTHMFLHGDFTHLFFNMFGLWMFGSVIERTWGAKRFMIFYFVTGFGASVLTQLTDYLYIREALNLVSSEQIDQWMNGQALYISEEVKMALNKIAYTYMKHTVGASGALFGILLAFGMLFPNQPIYLMFIPIPIKAKWMVIGYGTFELISGLSNIPGDNIAHFAHLGGMIFGYFMIRYWRKADINNRRWY